MLDDPSPQAAYDALPPDIPRDRPAPVVITRFVPCARGALIGYADVWVPSDHLTIRDIAILQIGDWISIRLPAATAPRFFEAPPPFRDQRAAQDFEREVIRALRHVLANGEGAP